MRVWRNSPETIRDQLQSLPANEALDVSAVKGAPRIVTNEAGVFSGLQNPVNNETVNVTPIFTWESKPVPTEFQGRAFISDVAGGFIFISNGTRWYPEGGKLNIDLMKTAVTNLGSTTEILYWRTLIRAGLVHDGDKIRVFASFSKTGDSSTEKSEIRWKMGTAGIATDAQILGPTLAVSATNFSTGFFFEIKRISPTQIRKVGNSNIGGSYNGSSTNPVAADPIAVINMDANDFYISFTNQTDGTVNTYTLHDYSIELITGV